MKILFYPNLKSVWNFYLFVSTLFLSISSILYNNFHHNNDLRGRKSLINSKKPNARKSAFSVRCQQPTKDINNHNVVSTKPHCLTDFQSIKTETIDYDYEYNTIQNMGTFLRKYP